MKETNQALEKIRNILESDGKTKIYFKERDGEVLLNDVLETIVKYWQKLNDEQQDNIVNIVLNKPKYLIGNEKWVLYNYICDMDTEIVHIRCGKYAYYKIKSMVHKTPIENEKYKEEYVHGILNGENVCLYCNHNIDKNQIILSGNENIMKDKFNLHIIDDVFPKDIVLYYA